MTEQTKKIVMRLVVDDEYIDNQLSYTIMKYPYKSNDDWSFKY